VPIVTFEQTRQQLLSEEAGGAREQDVPHRTCVPRGRGC
jgi:hypothetical protein